MAAMPGFLYTRNVLALFVARKITFATARHAFKERPIAVAGKDGAYVVDPAFD